MKTRHIELILAAAACLSLYPPAYAAQELTSDHMVALLRDTSILKPNVSLRATYDDRMKQAIVLTDRIPNSKPDDCKIDSVLIAKKLIDAFPDQINVVRVIFDVPEQGNAQQVDVTKVDVKAYGSGVVKASELLASLNLIDTSADVSLQAGSATSSMERSVVPGPFLDQRLILLGRIDKLREHGTGVKPFQAVFDKIEAEVPTGDQKKLAEDIDYLSGILKEQEGLLTNINLPINHTGTSGTSGTSSPSGTSGMSQGGHSRNKLQARIAYFPSVFERMRSHGKDTSELEDLLRQAQSYAASNQPQKAWTCVDEIQQMIQQVAGPHRHRQSQFQ